MNINDLAAGLGDACYGFLTLNFAWGLYCVVAVFRRLNRLRFKSNAELFQFVDELGQLMTARNFDEAKRRCENDQRALPQLALTCLSNRHLSFDQMRQLLAEIMQRDVISDLEYRIGWIATTIKSGPLLGLFGTVLGMMAAFGRIGQGQKVEPAQIADEIAVALICTAMGLSTAIPFGYFLAAINVRLKMLQDSLSSGLLRVLESYKK
jgi:biopolymer transport protein ExbB/TolQ